MNLRVSLSSRAWPVLARYSNALAGGLIVAAGLLFLAALRLGWIDILPAASEVAGQDAAARETPAVPTVVELTAEKLAAAKIHVTPAHKQQVQLTRAVPGEMKYDAARLVPVNAPVGGVVLEVFVEPGQAVAKDQPLAVLSSREVGEARDEVAKRTADLELAHREEERFARITANVDELLAQLDQRPDPESVEAGLAQKSLGDYRYKILGAYSKLVLAERRMKDTVDIGSGALSTRIVEERKNAREDAAAQYATARDNSRFDAQLERERAQAAREQAERLLSVAQQNLANLLGPLADMRPVTDREHLSELTLLAPLAGRIEERHAVKAARVAAGGALFTVADTSTIWVAAEIHERDWNALDLVHQGDKLQVRIPALAGDPLTAKVFYVGAQLAPDTRSVPLVAELANADGRLKPGMFVWADIPLDPPHEALVVPPGAVMRHENQPFVFVPAGERKYRRVEVRLGLETSDWIEIADGLNDGDLVVDRGAFYLKSELLLEREE